MSTSFGTTISSGIQDISAILSLFGTEECELHVGSALRGGGRGGYLYAAITPVSIFGSLGPAKAAFSIMLACLFPQKVQDIGLQPKGEVLGVILLDDGGKRYQAEALLLKLLRDHYVCSVQHVLVEHADCAHFIPWNLRLLMTSILVASLGVLPYIHFLVLRHTSFLALAIFFPICRVLGGLLCVFPGQLVMQYRIEMILKQRILFKRIDDRLEKVEIKMPTDVWDENIASESCLSVLEAFLRKDKSPDQALLKHLGESLHLPMDVPPSHYVVAAGIKKYLTGTWKLRTALVALCFGFLMTITGYVGCFTIVQGSSVPRDTYIWLAAEAGLAFIRLFIWARNPRWDDPNGFCLKLAPPKDSQLSAVSSTRGGRFPMIKISNHREFWEKLTAYAGPVNIDEIKQVQGFQHWYAWIKRDKEGPDPYTLCIILKGQQMTVLCRMNDQGDIVFHNADISPSGYAVQLEQLAEDHELMQKPLDFKLKVFQHYTYAISTKDRPKDCVPIPIQVSWPLSHSSVADFPPDPEGRNRRDIEDGGKAVDPWPELKIILDILMNGGALKYEQFKSARKIIADNSFSRDLNMDLSEYLGDYTKNLFADTEDAQNDLRLRYNAKWKIYSDATVALNHLFEPYYERAQYQRGRIDTVTDVALEQWKSNVLHRFSKQLRECGLATVVDRVDPLFISRNLTPYDMGGMNLKPAIFALIIGINEYISPELPNLRGCVNDARAFHKFLLNSRELQVPPSNIMCLMNSAATRAAILYALKAHFIDNSAIPVAGGTTMILFFSGLGNRVMTETVPINMICPFDERATVEGELVGGIPDDLLHNMLGKKGGQENNITVILDTCFSGGIGRGDFGPSRAAPIPSRLQQFETPSSQMNTPSIIWMLACKDYETAREVPNNTGLIMGRFTKSLIERLYRLPLEETTYADLDAHLPSWVDQTPQIIITGDTGSNKLMDRFLFRSDLRTDNAIRGVLLRPNTEKNSTENSFLVNMGSIAGVVPGTEFAVRTKDGMLSKLIAHSVKATQTVLVATENTTVELLNDARAYVTAWEPDMTTWNSDAIVLRVCLAPGFRHTKSLFPTNELAHLHERDNFVRVLSREMADIVLHSSEDSDQVIIEPLTLAIGCAVIGSSHAEARLPDIIDHIAHFTYFLERHPPGTRMEGFALEVHRLVGEIPSRKPDLAAGNNGNLIVRHEVKLDSDISGYGFTILNNLSADLFTYLFFFDPDSYTISYFHREPKLRGCMKATVDMGADKTFKNTKLSSGFLKLFVSTSPLDLDWIEQQESPLQGGLRSNRQSAKEHTDPFKERQWDTIRVVVTTD